MFQFYMCSGAILIAVGIVTVLYFLCLLKTGNNRNEALIPTSEALETLAIGIFYVTCAYYLWTATSGVPNPHVPSSVPIDTILNITNEEMVLNSTSSEVFDVNTTEETTTNTEQPPHEIDDFSVRYQQIFNNLLKRNASKVKEIPRKQRTESMKSEENCYYKTFLQHAMLAYSLTQSMVYLINKSIDCKYFSKTSKEDCRKSVAYKNTIQIFAAWILPVVCIVTLYYAAFKKPMETPVMTGMQPFNMQSLNKHLQVVYQTNTSAKDTEEIDRIIKNVINIVSMEKNKQRDMKLPEKLTAEKCDYAKMPLKLHTFVTVMLGYVLVLFYIQTVPMQDQKMLKHFQNMKVVTVLWLPAILELFTRLYLSTYMPNAVSDLFTMLGNSSHLLINITNILSSKKTNGTNLVLPEQ